MPSEVVSEVILTSAAAVGRVSTEGMHIASTDKPKLKQLQLLNDELQPLTWMLVHIYTRNWNGKKLRSRENRVGI